MTETTLHIGKVIEAELRRQKRSVTWLSQELFCDRTNIYSIFKRASIDSHLLFRISILLKCDLFMVYSDLYKAEIKVMAREEQNNLKKTHLEKS